MKIKFSNLKDFIEELEKDKDKVERGIVRVNTVTQVSKMSPAVHLVYVLAECIVVDFIAPGVISSHIIEYREYCGDLWGKGFECDEKTKSKVKELRSQLDAEFARLGITDIRGGTIEETEAGI